MFGTIVRHILTATALCHAIGPDTAAGGLIMVAALHLGHGACGAPRIVDRRDRLVLLDVCDARCLRVRGTALPFLV